MIFIGGSSNPSAKNAQRQSGAAAFSPATTTVLLDNATILKVRDNFPIATTPPALCLRVKVTAAP